MNIKQAKQEITNTLKAYLARDELGNYLIPTVRQRPVLLMGPPGVGKTQIMEQIAAETGVGLVAYTITHHTRQSAIGLPFIEKRTYGGEEVSVTDRDGDEVEVTDNGDGTYTFEQPRGRVTIEVTFRDGDSCDIGCALTRA